MRRYARQWPDRVWAIEGCAGIGKHIAVRLLADGEEVVDVPPKLSNRARVFGSGQGRKTDGTDTHSVALVGTRISLPGADLSNEQVSIEVVPKQDDEFTCSVCFLVNHRSAQVSADPLVCRDCA